MELHNKHHLGIERIMYVVDRMQTAADWKLIAEVVRACQVCRQVDPGPVTWEHGQLGGDLNWRRLAVDVAYVGGKPYLKTVDCGPNRFAIWTLMVNETTEHTIKLFGGMFLERGSPEEILCDYGSCFKSAKIMSFLNQWGVFCCAYKHPGNGMVKRNHRTIMRMVARSGRSVEGMVFWYNNTPNCANVIPAAALYNYETRVPG